MVVGKARVVGIMESVCGSLVRLDWCFAISRGTECCHFGS
jgi:hypothetical protein